MKTETTPLEELPRRMSAVNAHILEELNQFFEISKQIGKEKDRLGLPHFSPERESEMLIDIQLKNKGPMSQKIATDIFKTIFKASVDDMGMRTRKRLNISRGTASRDLVITVRGIAIGGGSPVLMAGPCAVESEDQIDRTAAFLHDLGVRILRGGAFKPRSSPYSFQGLEIEALKMLRRAADRYDMAVITEVLDTDTLSDVEAYADILQIGTRNMHNYSLLKRIGKSRKPVFLKRGLMSTMDEFILAAEYIYLGGNSQIILCERGIRTFETQTRNTLDISAVPILKQETILPVIVDISHSTGRKDIAVPIARAALAAGADGIMVESHIHPMTALSDANQQLDPEEMKHFLAKIPELVRP
jgi:3-deoxy-7-phosphoheptulonate synthase/chorismate mutase